MFQVSCFSFMMLVSTFLDIYHSIFVKFFEGGGDMEGQYSTGISNSRSGTVSTGSAD